MAIYREILISQEMGEARVALMENSRIEEYHVERVGSRRLVGNVFKAKVHSIVPGIQAAFINIGTEKNGFLYVSDVIGQISDYEEIAQSDFGVPKMRDRRRSPQRIEDLLKVDQEVLVQVVKEPISTKGARLTAHVTLPGRYVVLMPLEGHRGISKRIEGDKERQRLREVIEGLRLPEGIGLIVRTAASGVPAKQLERDVRYLLGLWHQIQRRAGRVNAPAVVHEELDVVLRVLRDSFTEEVNRVVVESRDEYKRITRFLRELMPHLCRRVHLYQGDIPLFEKEGVEDQIEKLYDRRVPLESGGDLIIEETESLVAIDVNSGRFTSRKSLEDTAFLTNKEAAVEIARQIRLRDLGGIIILDFIDMDHPSHRREVLNTLQRAMERDRAKLNVLAISEIGLVEMTRQRMRPSMEGTAYQDCPYCQGRGSVKSAQTMTIFALRQIKRFLAQTRAEHVQLLLHPEVAVYILTHKREELASLERAFKARVEVKPDATLHIEQVRIA